MKYPKFDKLCLQLLQFYSDFLEYHKSYPETILKVVSATFLLVCSLSPNKSTCQARKNVFYFTLKVLFVLEKIKL